jgi:hypothetical protein
MGVVMKEDSLIILNMVLVCINGQMAENMRGSETKI